ncbi:T9SS type A sorting domain-containing protein [Flavobacterium sp. XGLA_31]|uniref:T9SS type A sorting domain-containing protein n=1 Tax=Flavobacterium sp. XGLA_31 TaxID=3447666 RepID=UPI003F2E0CDC
MKKLLLSCLLFAVGSGAFAQGSCATAVNITANGTFTAGTVNGTYSNPCLGGTTTSTGAAIKARWWKYTPTANGEITVTSDLAANPIATTDTRLSILKAGTTTACTGMTCVDYNDDVDATPGVDNYRSTVTVPVAAGTTYFIEWDNYWASTSFTFQFTFTAASCIRPGALDFYRPDSYTTTSASLYWNNAIGSPASYDIDWSTNFTDAEGTGTIVNVPAGTTTYTQGDISGLPESLNFRYFVRSNCGATQSAWQGPYYGYLAVTLPYSNDFENADNNYTDGFIGFSRTSTDDTATPPIYGDGDTGNFLYTFNSTTADSDKWGYSRAISLAAGEVVTINFKTRLWAPDPDAVSEMTLDVTVGDAQSTTAQTTVLNSIATSDDTAYTDQTAEFTAPADGVYYFGFHNNSVAGATQTYMFIDTLDISSVLSTNSFISSKLRVYPNPSSNLVNISNDVNATINSVEMTDLNGRVVKSLNVNATNGQVSIADLATGIYMMKIKTDQGTAVKKIVKE